MANAVAPLGQADSDVTSPPGTPVLLLVHDAGPACEPGPDAARCRYVTLDGAALSARLVAPAAVAAIPHEGTRQLATWSQAHGRLISTGSGAPGPQELVEGIQLTTFDGEVVSIRTDEVRVVKDRVGGSTLTWTGVTTTGEAVTAVSTLTFTMSVDGQLSTCGQIAHNGQHYRLLTTPYGHRLDQLAADAYRRTDRAARADVRSRADVGPAPQPEPTSAPNVIVTMPAHPEPAPSPRAMATAPDQASSAPGGSASATARPSSDSRPVPQDDGPAGQAAPQDNAPGRHTATLESTGSMVTLVASLGLSLVGLGLARRALTRRRRQSSGPSAR